MKKIILIFICMLAITYLHAQSTMSSSADYGETANLSLNWTLGEAVVETVSDDTHILTQGFYQGTLEKSTVGLVYANSYPLKLYPNPAADFVVVDVSEGVTFETIRLTDLSGHMVLESKQNTIAVSALPQGVYIVNIISKEQKTYQCLFVKD